MTHLPIAIVGAGPVGLAAAIHLLDRGLEPVIFEAGETPGSAVLAWGHVRMFSPWQYDVDPAAAKRLAAHGWRAPDPAALPTGREFTSCICGPWPRCRRSRRGCGSPRRWWR